MPQLIELTSFQQAKQYEGYRVNLFWTQAREGAGLRGTGDMMVLCKTLQWFVTVAPNWELAITGEGSNSVACGHGGNTASIKILEVSEKAWGSVSNHLKIVNHARARIGQREISLPSTTYYPSDIRADAEFYMREFSWAKERGKEYGIY